MDISELEKLMFKSASVVEKKKEDIPDFSLDDDGEEYMSVGIPGLMAASEKLLAVNRGMADTDERDSLRYQKVLRPHSMIRESIKMDAGKVARQAMYTAAKRRNLSGMGPAPFDSYVQRLLVGNPLTTPLEEINPMHLVESARRITKMGPGGLGSDESITEESQSVHPSQFGFLCTISGPESARAGIDVRAAWGAKLGSNGRLYQKFKNKRTGRMEWLCPDDVADLTVKIPD